MSKMKDLAYDIEQLYCEGLSEQAIAEELKIPIEMVMDCLNEFGNYALYDESMDGDFDTAMASAGFGTDEDYGFCEV
jgi:orotate phosphoribosyltransferase-like protein